MGPPQEENRRREVLEMAGRFFSMTLMAMDVGKAVVNQWMV